jgi:hypothetical protein
MSRNLRRLSVLVLLCLALATQGLATGGHHSRLDGVDLDGLINAYTADLDGAGAWHVAGPWSLDLRRGGRKADFTASLSMGRADNPVRQAHTHHVQLTHGKVTAITGGFSVTGAAEITGNGVLSGISGSMIVVEITGGAAVPHANIRLTFQDGAVGHFGDQPLTGVVQLR